MSFWLSDRRLGTRGMRKMSFVAARRCIHNCGGGATVVAAYIVHGWNAKSSLTGRVCSSRSRGQTVAGSVSLSSSTGIMSSAHRASKSSVSTLENCMVSRMLGSRGVGWVRVRLCRSADGRSRDSGERFVKTSSGSSNANRSESGRTVFDAWRRLIAASWLEHVAGCQLEAPSWDSEDPNRSCPPLQEPCCRCSPCLLVRPPSRPRSPSLRAPKPSEVGAPTSSSVR